MPITVSYPGVYVEEIPSAVHTITGVATSITAFVGYTVQGPVNRAIRISSFADFQRGFGGLNRASDVSYAVQQFFLNGGSDAYVVRVAQGAAAATVTLKYDGPAGNDALVVAAASAGDWGNRLQLDVDYATTNPDSTFNMTVTRSDLQNGTLVQTAREQHLNLSMNSHASTYAPSVVNSASNLVQLQRPIGLAFANTDRGWSMSGELSAFPALLATQTTIAGLLDGIDPFTLVLTGALANSPATLVTALNNAITAAGLSARLQAQQTDALGAPDVAGNFVKLTSLFVNTNANTNGEFSSVQVTTAPANDVAKALKLGLANGGREQEGASARRPRQTGAASADLNDLVGTPVAGALDVTINDHSTGAAVAIVSTKTTPVLPNTNVGPALVTALQNLIRALSTPGSPIPAVQNATVQLVGTSLRIVPSANTPNASIVLGNALGVALRLTGAGAFENVQRYTLGSGASFGAQTGAAPGVDGSPPGPADIIGVDANKTGIYALRDIDLFNLLVIPGTAQLGGAAPSVINAAMALCEERRAFYVVDADPSMALRTIAGWVGSVDSSKNAAVYFPWIQAADPLDGFRPRGMPPAGAIAGIFARTDSQRGVWKAPAGTEGSIQGAQGLTYTLTDAENGQLNPLGINCLRTFPVYGRVVWGARTLLGSDQAASEWKYIPVRRLALMIEESLYRGTKWVVFEPNAEPLWSQVRLNVGAFMHDLFRRGAFQGAMAQQAYLVKCDDETTTQDDVDRGIVNILVGFAPLKPAEFVILQIQQLAGQLQV